VCVAIR